MMMAPNQVMENKMSKIVHPFDFSNIMTYINLTEHLKTAEDFQIYIYLKTVFR